MSRVWDRGFVFARVREHLFLSSSSSFPRRHVSSSCEIASVITLEEPLAKMAYEFLLYVLASSSFEREQALSCRDHLRHTTHVHIQVLDLQQAQREVPSQRTRHLRPHAGPGAALRPCFGGGTQLPSVLRQAPLSSVPVKVHSIAVYCCD